MLDICALFVGSPTALADPQTERTLRTLAEQKNPVYVPAGAFWGAIDVAKVRCSCFVLL